MPARRRRLISETDSVPLVVNSEGFTHNWHNLGSTHEQNDQHLNLFNRSTVSLNDTEDRMPRDRSKEFASAVRSLQSRPIRNAVAARDVRRVKLLQSYGEFMIVAKSIGKNIASTYSKLEKLTLLVKRKPLFNDSPAEIQELSYIIKEDLKGVSEQLKRLQSLSNVQNVSQQKTGHKHLLSHSNTVVETLQSKLANISHEFKQVLDTRTQNLKQAKDRRDQFSETIPPPGPGASSSVFRHSQPSILLSRNEVAQMDDAESYKNYNNSAALQASSQQMIYAVQDQTDDYLQNRADAMHNIESTIVELGGIFQQLAHMVHEQRDMVERIDSNVLDAEMNIEAAHHQILRYFQSVSSNRWLMMKIFAVIMFFFAFFAIFLA